MLYVLYLCSYELFVDEEYRFFLAIVELMAMSDNANYIPIICSDDWLANTGGFTWYFLIFSKASSHFSIHSEVSFNIWKNGLHLSEYLEMNPPSAANHPLRHWISLLVGDDISLIAHICSGFASIPLCVNKFPKNLLDVRPNEQFIGLSFKLYFHNLSKKSCKCCVWLHFSVVLTTVSSIYAFTFFTNEFHKHCVYQLLIGTSCILEAKGRDVYTVISDECNVFMIWSITKINCIRKTHKKM